MRDYCDWLENQLGGSFLWSALILLNFAALGVLAGVLVIAYVYSVIMSYGITLLVPIVWTWWYYTEYGMDDE